MLTVSRPAVDTDRPGWNPSQIYQIRGLFFHVSFYFASCAGTCISISNSAKTKYGLSTLLQQTTSGLSIQLTPKPDLHKTITCLPQASTSRHFIHLGLSHRPADPNVVIVEFLKLWNDILIGSCEASVFFNDTKMMTKMIFWCDIFLHIRIKQTAQI